MAFLTRVPKTIGVIVFTAHLGSRTVLPSPFYGWGTEAQLRKVTQRVSVDMPGSRFEAQGC